MATKKSSRKSVVAASDFEPGITLGRTKSISFDEDPVEVGVIVKVMRVHFIGGRYEDGTKARVTFMTGDGEERTRDLPGSYAEQVAWYTGSTMRVVASGKGRSREYEIKMDRRAKRLASLPEIPEETVDLSKSKKGRAKRASASLRPKGKPGRKAKS